MVSWLKRYVDNDTRYEQFLCPTPRAAQFSDYQDTCPGSPDRPTGTGAGGGGSPRPRRPWRAWASGGTMARWSTDRRGGDGSAPLFLAGVAVLAVNDHVLKDRFPGWWTGKLSDVAGVAVAAVVAAVVVGPAGGVAFAALGFAALKSVPGVAEAMAPALGGVTARDRSDLLALAVLVPGVPPAPLASATRPAAGGPRRRPAARRRHRRGPRRHGHELRSRPGRDRGGRPGPDLHARSTTGRRPSGWSRTTTAAPGWPARARPASIPTAAGATPLTDPGPRAPGGVRRRRRLLPPARPPGGRTPGGCGR